MDKKIRKIVENGEGAGKLFEDGVFFDDVSYRFQIVQEFIETGTSTIPGLKDMSGVLKLKTKMIDISGKLLKLELSDSRLWNITVLTGDFIEQEYHFVMGPGN